MNVNSDKRSAATRQSGFTLLEAMAYGALLVVLFGLAYGAYYRCLEHSKQLKTNADQIVRAVTVGELWREDVRRAKSISIENNYLDVHQADQVVTWFVHNGTLRRWTSADQKLVQMMTGIKNSRMAPDRRPQASGWRWELELQPTQKDARTIPLFTFLSVQNQSR